MVDRLLKRGGIMREHKYRAWIEEKECYADGCTVYSDGSFEAELHDQYIKGFAGGTTVGGYDCILEQYTGHKNWCENDIIRTDHFIDVNKKQQYLYHQIVWSEKYLSWFAKNCGNDGDFNELDNGNIPLWVLLKSAVNPEISGTIHEVKS